MPPESRDAVMPAVAEALAGGLRLAFLDAGVTAADVTAVCADYRRTFGRHWWGVSVSTRKGNFALCADVEQARLPLTPEEAEAMRVALERKLTDLIFPKTES
jgi:hypothetical protein